MKLHSSLRLSIVPFQTRECSGWSLQGGRVDQHVFSPQPARCYVLNHRCCCYPYPTSMQSFIKTAATIDKKIQDGVFDISNESYGIKVGYGGIPGPSGGRDGASSQGDGCCG